MLRKSLAGRGNGQGKGPEAAAGLASWKAQRTAWVRKRRGAAASRAGRARRAWGGVRGRSDATIEALSARAGVRGLGEGSVLPLLLRCLPLRLHLPRWQRGASWVSQPPCPETRDDQAGRSCVGAPRGPLGQPASGQHMSLLRDHCAPLDPSPEAVPVASDAPFSHVPGLSFLLQAASHPT